MHQCSFKDPVSVTPEVSFENANYAVEEGNQLMVNILNGGNSQLQVGEERIAFTVYISVMCANLLLWFVPACILLFFVTQIIVRFIILENTDREFYSSIYQIFYYRIIFLNISFPVKLVRLIESLLTYYVAYVIHKQKCITPMREYYRNGNLW